MDSYKRRSALKNTLLKRRYDTTENLAVEFDVSERTIRRDILILNDEVPLITKPGRYGGGIYVMEGYSPNRFYLKDYEIDTLQKALAYICNSSDNPLTQEDIAGLADIINNYSRPKTQRRG